MKRVQIRMKATKDTRCECLRREQDWHLYFNGYTRPHFKLPAIRQHYEFGWSLSDSQPVLMHVVQGAYDETSSDTD